MDRIGGGAGFDLDSYATLLPSDARGRTRALIADVGLGLELLERSPEGDRRALAEGYGLAEGDPAARIAAYRSSPRAARLGRYLDLVAGLAPGSRRVTDPHPARPGRALSGRTPRRRAFL
jgi:hypothetical protein